MTELTSRFNMYQADLIIEELIRNGVDFFCISPGSRSTPLACAVAEKEKTVGITVHYDERGASFHALGHTRATGRPAALICTSGTATANYMPAVVEASMDMLPLIILTADRPPELRDCGANQTIDQTKIYRDYVRWQIDLPCPDLNIPFRFVLTSVDQAVYRAVRSPAGPVHLNCMFREPFLSEHSDLSDDDPDEAIRGWRQSKQLFSRYIQARPSLDEDQITKVAAIVKATSTGYVIAGHLTKATEREAALRFSQKLGWPLLPDIRSGLRIGVSSDNVIPCYDLLLACKAMPRIVPHATIIQVGGPFVSKRLLEFLKENPPDEFIYVADHPCRHDPGYLVTTRIESSVSDFSESLLRKLGVADDKPINNSLKKATAIVSDTLNAIVDNDTGLSEPLLARLISQHIRKDTGLFLANSMPVRDIDMFADNRGAKVEIGCNRGASGIDGTIASATGFAVGLDRPVTLLIGDLAFLHDLNSLALLKSVKLPVVLIVINNDGGGIFSFLPVAHHTKVFERYFATPHGITFENAAKLFGVDYQAPASAHEFIACYRKAQESSGHTIIEIRTDRGDNYEIHQAIIKNVKEALSGL